MRSRGRRVSVAAAIVLAVAACATGCRGQDQPGGDASAAPHVEVTGRSVPYRGLQRWTTASIESRSDRRLTVFAVGDERKGGGPCGPPILRIRAIETDETVRVAVAEYQDPLGTTIACPAIGYLAGPHVVVLSHPLGTRRLVDQRTGATRTPLVGTDVPTITHPPAPSATSLLSREEDPPTVRRTWSVSGQAVLTLEVTTPSATRESSPYGRIVGQTSVHGSSATIYRDGAGEYGQRTVRWTPNRRQTLTLRLGNAPGRRWSDADALSLARAVTGYATVATGRVPDAVTPGTAAEVFNSAEGPVRRQDEFLKSGGVYVGVNCVGRGRMAVTIRGERFPFACGDRLSHRVVTSHGSPSKPFAVDIDADDGVRWAVTLARVSTDGT